jgi:hypothetical protein
VTTAEAAHRTSTSLWYAGDALFTDVAEICDVLQTSLARGPQCLINEWF